jgi:hypothetical protein
LPVAPHEEPDRHDQSDDSERDVDVEHGQRGVSWRCADGVGATDRTTPSRRRGMGAVQRTCSRRRVNDTPRALRVELSVELRRHGGRRRQHSFEGSLAWKPGRRCPFFRLGVCVESYGAPATIGTRVARAGARGA